VLSSGLLPLPEVAAGTTATVDLPDLGQVDHLTGEVWLFVSMELASSKLWADAGHQIAWGQFRIGGLSLKSKMLQKRLSYGIESPEVSDRLAILTLLTPDVVFEFDKSIDKIIKWSVQGNGVFEVGNGPQLTFWKAPTDNDIPEIAQYWALFGLDAMQKQVRSVSHGFEDGNLQITTKSWVSPPILAWGFDTTTKYTVQGDGTIIIHTHAEPCGSIPTTLPRFGLEMKLNKGTETLKWFGLGPGEAYRDMKQAGKLGVWTKDVDDMITLNAFPQESGNRTDTRWVHLLNSKGSGIRAELQCDAPKNEGGFDFNVNRHSAYALEKAKHPHELAKSDEVIFRIDGGHHGLGTASCGPPTLEQHSLKTQVLDFTVLLTPIGV
jgi:beta-galactosidase